MSFVDQAIQDPATWALTGLALLAFGWTAYNRSQWNVSWPADSRLRIPEKDPSYDAASLESFVQAAASVRVQEQPALDFYVKRILRGSDLAFAVTLATLATYIWYLLAVSSTVPPLLGWIALPAGTMSIVYGLADVAEDIKLASILDHPSTIDRAEAAAANMLTRIKLVAIFLSLVGGALFGIYWIGERILTQFLKRKSPVAVAGR